MTAPLRAAVVQGVAIAAMETSRPRLPASAHRSPIARVNQARESRFCRRHPRVDVVLVGARTAAHLDNAIAAMATPRPRGSTRRRRRPRRAHRSARRPARDGVGLAQPQVDVVLVSARTTAHLDYAIAAMETSLDPALGCRDEFVVTAPARAAHRQRQSSMRVPLLAASLAGPLAAAVIQGVVLENQTGYPMARATVSLKVVTATGVSELLSQFTGRGGQFSFPAVAPGSYILSAVREGYFPASYGQRKPYGRGAPIEIDKDANFFTELRLLRMGAITGRVLDENRVGLMNVGVVAYPAKLPLRPERTVKTDDRGVYRVWGLRSGKYWVRSVTSQVSGMNLLPTFTPEAIELRDTKMIDVRLDAESPDVNIVPVEGKLLTLNGSALCPSQFPLPVHVTIASDSGRLEANTFCNGGYQFTGLAPGHYEVYAEAGVSKTGSEYSVHTELLIDSDRANGTLELKRTPEVSAEVRLPPPEGTLRTPIELTVRRADLAGVLGTRAIPLNRGYLDFRLDPGNYEVHATPPPEFWVVDVRNAFARPRRRARGWTAHPDWFETYVEANQAVHFEVVLQRGAAGIRGLVTNEGKPVAGIPVFLWPEKEGTRRSARGPRETQTNVKGEYRFSSLPPGGYRLLASFDFDEIDSDVIESARAPSATLKPSETGELNLTPYVAP